jgi:hypothetical protein
LRFDTDEGAESCRAGQSGTYEVNFVDDDTVELALVDDECFARGSDLGRGLTRVGD